MAKDTKLFLRLGLSLWVIQTLVLASGAALLMFSDGDWVYHFEQYQLVRNVMAIIEAARRSSESGQTVQLAPRLEE